MKPTGAIGTNGKESSKKENHTELLLWFISYLREDKEDGIKSLAEIEGSRAAIDIWGESLKKNNRWMKVLLDSGEEAAEIIAWNFSTSKL